MAVPSSCAKNKHHRLFDPISRSIARNTHRIQLQRCEIPFHALTQRHHQHQHERESERDARRCHRPQDGQTDDLHGGEDVHLPRWHALDVQLGRMVFHRREEQAETDCEFEVEVD